ncbi:MAG: NAD(P)/FAD-dependent oxidoreductase [Polyangiaceae bacterium]|nr:NAD(P)/FAD-dependent oxidoreductase [Polyangiaceae bacterium]
MATKKHRVVIVGGGFGGLYAAKALRRVNCDVVLIDRRNHHVFQPLLYQVATAALNPSEIATPIRKILRGQNNVQIMLGDVHGVDAAAKTVLLEGAAVPYDSLILAAGATHSYFGQNHWAIHAPGLKSIEDALEIRRRVLLAYEAAELTTDPKGRSAWLTFVVVGAGPTGVELAGALKEIATHALREDFSKIDSGEARVILIEGADRVLPPYVPELSLEAENALQQLGVEVKKSARVTNIDDSGVNIGDERIVAKTVLWAAGVQASPVAKSLGVPLDRAGRVIVEPDLTIKEHPDIFVIGDLAAAQSDGKPVPGVAGAAVQGGQHAARNIALKLAKKPLEPFHYVDKGSLATIGRAAAVADFGRIKMHGFIAWLAWLFIHVFLLIGFRNRFIVIFQWAWSYFTYERGARLITGDSPPLLGPGATSYKSKK